MGNNVKFFESNLITDSCSFSFTSADIGSAAYLYDEDRLKTVTSSGSNDSTPEVFTITFATSVSINSILIDNHNIKSGTIKYWNGSSYVNFSTSISYSSNSETTHFHEFNQVSTTKIQITANTTIVANSEKYIGEFRALKLIGEPEVNASKITPTIYRDEEKITTTNGRIALVVHNILTKYVVEFSNASNSDMSLFYSLYLRTSPFYVYPSGGIDRGNTPYRLQDMYRVLCTGKFSPKLVGNLFGLGDSISLTLEPA